MGKVVTDTSEDIFNGKGVDGPAGAIKSIERGIDVCIGFG